jgi:hypothetical protein
MNVDYDVFTNNSTVPQDLVVLQFMTTLYQFGIRVYTLCDVCNSFGILEGSVHIFTCHVIVALYSLQNIA